MKLIHTADLHIDSAMEANLPPEKARLRRKELLLTLGAIADLAEREGARAVLLAGDVFDTDRPAGSAVRYLLDTVSAHPSIDFLMLYGNHAGDFRLPADGLPQNLKLFDGSGYSVYRYGSTAIYGAEDPSAELPALSAEEFNIVMLHGQAAEHRHAPDEIDLASLRDRGIDYLALGHIHSPRIEKLDTRGFWCYPGCPEGRGFDEVGERGVVLLSTDGERLTKSFLPIARRTLHDRAVDISECGSQRELEDAVTRAVAEISEGDLLRIRLTGARPANLPPDLLQLTMALENSYFFVEILDESTVLIDPLSYENDLSLRGEFVRTVLSLKLPPEEEGLILTAGLAVLDGEEVPF